METVKAAVLLSSLWAGSFLYGTGSLAVQEEAQCPNRGGVTCSQDSILSGPRGPVPEALPLTDWQEEAHPRVRLLLFWFGWGDGLA